MSSTLKVGVIGVRGIANTHFPGWRDSPHTELCALADVDATVLSAKGTDLGISKLYQDPYELIADPDIAIVDICTPNMYHAPLWRRRPTRSRR